MTFAQVFYNYRIIIVEFLFEYAVFYVLFLHKFERKSKFALKTLISAVSIAATGFCITFFYTAFGGTVWGRVITYFALFVVFTLFAKLCFNEPFSKILFACSMAYAVQNLTYKIYLIFWTVGEYFGMYDGWGDSFNIYYRIFYYSVFAICAVVFWFVFIRKITAKLQIKTIDYKMLLIALAILVITIFLCSVEDIGFAKLCVERENRFELPVFYILRQTGNVFSVVCCIIVLILSSKSLVESELLQEVEYLKYTIKQSERQYQASKESIELINIKCHDIKYKLNALAANGTLTPQAVDELRNSISIYDTKTDTGNRILDVLLTEKKFYCEQDGIIFSYIIDGEKLNFMETSDLYCMFGNIIDNAIQAVKALAEKERKVINVSVKEKGKMLLVQAENYFDGELEFKDGLPVSSKEDKNSHGFGLRSLRLIVKKYGGELNVSVSEGIFHLNIIFPLSQ